MRFSSTCQRLELLKVVNNNINKLRLLRYKVGTINGLLSTASCTVAVDLDSPRAIVVRVHYSLSHHFLWGGSGVQTRAGPGARKMTKIRHKPQSVLSVLRADDGSYSMHKPPSALAALVITIRR